MALTTEEGLRNAGNICIALADAASTDSDGGTKITVSEITTILAKQGIQLINDVLDNDAPVPPPEG